MNKHRDSRAREFRRARPEPSPCRAMAVLCHPRDKATAATRGVKAGGAAEPQGEARRDLSSRHSDQPQVQRDHCLYIDCSPTIGGKCCMLACVHGRSDDVYGQQRPSPCSGRCYSSTAIAEPKASRNESRRPTGARTGEHPVDSKPRRGAVVQARDL
jgi:hypothetical protein